jgi:hypothetical protein
MSDELNWDDVLGEVDADEKENPSTSNDFEALPKGPYNVVVQEAEKQVASTGKDMIKLRVQVTDGPYANRVLFNYIVFSQGNPKAMRMTLERLAAFGVTRETIAAHKPSVSQIADMLVGRRAVARVDIQQSGDYAGRNEIKGFKPLDGAEQAPVNVPAATQPGVPNIPQPAPAPVQPQPAAAPQPNIPTPEVPVGAGSTEAPFG